MIEVWFLIIWLDSRGPILVPEQLSSKEICEENGKRFRDKEYQENWQTWAWRCIGIKRVE